MADVKSTETIAPNPFVAPVEPVLPVEHEDRTDEQASVEEKPEPEESKHDPKDDISKEIEDHEKWMADHSDDARAVQLRLQEVAVLQQKLIELEAAERGVGKASESALDQNHTLHDV